MDCRRARSHLAALSADHLPVTSVTALRDHLARCSECQQEWLMFQETLLILSVTSQPILTSETTHRMWQQCFEQRHEQIERKRLEAQRPAFWNWALRQPRWGWAALGGAVAILGSVWFFPPQDAPLNNGLSNGEDRPAPSLRESTPHDASGSLIVLQRPPEHASPWINHHAAMAFDPFTDHVGSTLVSYSATTSRP